MIIQYDGIGNITQLVYDPVPQGLMEALVENNVNFLSYSPTKIFNENGESVGYKNFELDINSNYIDIETHELKNRLTLDVPTNVTLQPLEVFKVDNLPNGCKIIFNGDEHQLEDNEFEISIEEEGDYKISLLTPVEYNDLEILLTITDKGE